MKPTTIELLSEGLIAGTIGYVCTTLFFMLASALAGQSPFHMAALLGGALFYGLHDPSQVVVWPGVVLAYNGVHLLVFLLLGMIAAWFAALAERGPEFWYIAITLYILVLFHVYGIVQILSESFRASIPVWVSFGGTFVASIAMAGYLLWARPKLRLEVREFRE
jgi:hypothetical protein